jgi:hypothetical protein
MTIADGFAIFFGLVGTFLGLANWWVRRESVQFQDIHVSARVGQRPESKVPGVDGGQVPTAVWMLVRCNFALFKARGEKETWVRSKRLILGRHTCCGLSRYFQVPQDGVLEEQEASQKKLGAPGVAATPFELARQVEVTPELEELFNDVYLLYKIQEFVQERRIEKPELTKYYSWGHDARSAAWIIMGSERESIRAKEALDRASRGVELTEEDVLERRKVIQSKIAKAMSEMEDLATQLETDPNHEVAWQRADGKWFHS